MTADAMVGSFDLELATGVLDFWARFLLLLAAGLLLLAPISFVEYGSVWFFSFNSNSLATAF